MIARIVLLICAVVLLTKGAIVKPAPENQCYQINNDGTVTWYPLYASWPSREPGICVGYYCEGANDTRVDKCRYVPPDCTGDNVCYQIGRNDLLFPYCCIQWDCSPDNQRTLPQSPCTCC